MVITNSEIALKRLVETADTISVSKALLGCYLSYQSAGEQLVGRIVETEAYLAENDPACHAYKGITNRNRVMFGVPAHAYVYIIYGIYHCLNVVTAADGVPEAVLIRALEPVSGITLMQQKRNQQKETALCSGPGKLCQAFGINKALNGFDLFDSQLRLLPADHFGRAQAAGPVVTTTRIGLSKGVDLPYRYYLRESPHVSVRVKNHAQ